MGATWKSGPRRRRNTHHSVLTLGVAVFVLLASTVTILSIQRAKSTNRMKTAANGESGLPEPDSSVILGGVSGADTKDPPTPGKPAVKPDNKPSANQDRGQKLPPPGNGPSAPAPPPPPTLPPDQPFDVYGPITLSLQLGESRTVSFTTNDDSSVNWSGSGPEQNEIAAGFSDSTGPGYSVTFEALEAAMVDTEVTFTIHISDPERNISMDKDILVTIVE